MGQNSDDTWGWDMYQRTPNPQSQGHDGVGNYFRSTTVENFVSKSASDLLVNDDGSSDEGISPMTKSFIIVGSLFALVVILAAVNLYIEFGTRFFKRSRLWNSANNQGAQGGTRTNLMFAA